jgi:hypothetical protein
MSMIAGSCQGTVDVGKQHTSMPLLNRNDICTPSRHAVVMKDIKIKLSPPRYTRGISVYYLEIDVFYLSCPSARTYQLIYL